MTKRALTFSEFQATGREVADMRDSDIPTFHDHEAYPTATPGRLYADDRLYMERDGEQWFFEWGSAFLTSDLQSCEVELYGCYLAEIAGDNVNAYLRDIAPPSRCNPKPEDSEESLVALLEAFCAYNGITPRCAHELTYEVKDADQLRWLHRYCLRWDVTVDGDELAKDQLAALDASR